jgi:hyperosmotically inducible periplasmic protein
MKRPWITALTALCMLASAPLVLAEDLRPDNSGANVRDRGGETLTPIDQADSAEDLRITQSIRKAVVEDDALSVNAQNVKIITQNGVVTLRGPVGSEAERASIAAKAKGVAGVTRIDNQLEIASP